MPISDQSSAAAAGSGNAYIGRTGLGGLLGFQRHVKKMGWKPAGQAVGEYATHQNLPIGVGTRHQSRVAAACRGASPQYLTVWSLRIARGSPHGRRNG